MNAILRTSMVFIILTAIMAVVGIIVDRLTGHNYVFFVVFSAISVIMCFITMWWSKPLALRANKAHIITREENPRLYGIVEKVANEAGLPMPEVGISDYDMPNAFATGRSPSNAAVVATRGILEVLNDDELEGVFGHEMSHVKNRDILVMSATSAVISVLTYAAHYAMFSSLGDRDRENGALIIVLMLISYILVPIAGLLLQMAVSRSREYLADETGARITKKPLALASALRKLEKGCQNPRNEYDDTAHSNMWISEPVAKKPSFFATLFATHPATADRIARLEKIAEGMKNGSIPDYVPEESYGNHSGLSIK